MGSPVLDIRFQELINSVIERSKRGEVLLIMPDDIMETEYMAFHTMPDNKKVSEENLPYIKMAFLGGAAKVTLIRSNGNMEAALALARSMSWNWLAAPLADEEEKEQIAGFIREEREKGKGFKAILGAFENADSEGIVNLANEYIVSDILGEEDEYSPERYSAYMAGILAGLSLERSATGLAFPDIRMTELRMDADSDIEQGRLIFIPNGSGFEIARAVTSLVSENDTPRSFRKIKNVEGADLIRSDIARIFTLYYKGKKTNSYANRQALCADIIAYFRSLEGDVLTPEHNNTVSLDAEAQRNYLESIGENTEDKTDREILLMNTGEKVFLRADIRLLDAMEDLYLMITLA
ncbi:MAG: hypothetical protein J6D00_03605 [Christensenellaceae bacterium]|nr:hypothetical protein [Christensenellaceae bacterium]